MYGNEMKIEANLKRIIIEGIRSFLIFGPIVFLYVSFKYYFALDKYGKSYYSLNEYYLYCSIAILIGLFIFITWRYIFSPVISIKDEHICIRHRGSEYSLAYDIVKGALYRPRRNRLWALVGEDGTEIYIPDGYIEKKLQEHMSQRLYEVLTKYGVKVRLC
jgi:hypothetical protein